MYKLEILDQLVKFISVLDMAKIYFSKNGEIFLF